MKVSNFSPNHPLARTRGWTGQFPTLGLQPYTTNAGGSLDRYYALGSVSGTATVDLANGNYQSATMTAATTWTFTGATSGYACSFVLELGGNFTPTWPGSVSWLGGVVPDQPTTGVGLYVFFSHDGGTTWYGAEGGNGGAGSGLTPSHLWRPLLTSAGAVVTAGAGGEAIMAYCPA